MLILTERSLGAHAQTAATLVLNNTSLLYCQAALQRFRWELRHLTAEGIDWPLPEAVVNPAVID